jgi:multidrug efflux pump subunit AcrA (membrane-fusion protein)
MKKNKSSVRSLCLTVALFASFFAHAEEETKAFRKAISVYGVIKPAKMTNLIAVNNGMVSKIHRSVGDRIGFGKVAISVIERETTRGYRSTILGNVAKLHVSEGAAVTPGMPLVTIIDPNEKLIEISLSPSEASDVKVGNSVFRRGEEITQFGKIRSVSPLVDPDTGGVIAYVGPKSQVENLIGDILPLEVVTQNLSDCKVVNLKEIDQFLQHYKVVATSGKRACLQAKK